MYDRKALEFELAGYVRRGLTDRADQVRALLRMMDDDTSVESDAPVEQASAAPGEKRTTKRG
jgi:hypothetical protein